MLCLGSWHISQNSDKTRGVTTLDILAWLLGLFTWLLPRRFKLPELIIGHPLDPTSEEYLCWWHFPVCIKSRFWQFNRLHNCRIFLLIGGGSGETQLLWCGKGEAAEPTDTVTLQNGDDPWLVPTIARLDTVEDRWLCAARDRLPSIKLDPFRLLVTDLNVIRWHFKRNNLPPGEYQIQFRVKIGKDKLESRIFNLIVPPENQGNEAFRIR